MDTRNSQEQLWLRRFREAPTAPVRLVCFPYAGGSASFYFPYARDLSPHTEVLAVQYPGRQDRRHEPGCAGIGRLADAIADVLPGQDERPYAFFGHSMGAVVAFEVALRLAQR